MDASRILLFGRFDSLHRRCYQHLVHTAFPQMGRSSDPLVLSWGDA
ncbi:MAG TPA: hypothetical protein VJB10_03915 [Candidatus Peribacteraceae bacterium]|nr:hypothetical protein [Candidatus Peribacteraceae bacterium]